MGLIALPVKGLGYFASSVLNSKSLIERLRGRKGAGTHGSAEWADEKTLKPYFRPSGFLIGLWGKKKVYAGSESNVLMAARRGAGKSQYIIAAVKCVQFLPVLPDLLVVDAAGDIEANTWETLKALGYKCTRLDQFNPVEKYDVISILNAGLANDFEYDVKDLARLIVPSEPNSKQPHFVEYIQRMVAESLYYAAKYDMTTLDVALRSVFDDKERKKLLERAKIAKKLDVLPALVKFDTLGGPEQGSMNSTMVRKLEPWLTKAVREINDCGPTRGWTFDTLYSDKTPWVIYVRTGLRDDVGHYARAVMGNAVNHVKRRWNHTNKPLAKGLWVIVDEAHVLGECRAINDVNRELRKANVNFLLSFTDLNSLKNTYSDYQSLIAGSDHIFMGGGSKDLEWMKLIKDLAGKKTVYSHGESESDGGESKSKHETGADLAGVELLRGLPKSENVVLLSDCVARLTKPIDIRMKWPKL